MQAELMYETIREWPRYVKIPFPIAKVNIRPIDDIRPVKGHSLYVAPYVT